MRERVEGRSARRVGVERGGGGDECVRERGEPARWWRERGEREWWVVCAA